MTNLIHPFIDQYSLNIYITLNNIYITLRPLHAIIDQYQSAYLSHRSTDTAITLIINDILISLDKKPPCYLMILDISSAFDTLNNNILSINLNKIGIHG